jgi:hypothetical protein
MRETITFPRPRHRSLRLVVMFALLGAALLVLGLPGPIADQGRASPGHAGGVAVVEP